MLLMRENIDSFITCYVGAVEVTRGKNPTVIHVSSDEVCRVASAMRRERNNQHRSQSARGEH
jgi:hypothetical protein